MSDLQNQIDAAIQAHDAQDATAKQQLTDALSAAKKAKDDLAAANAADATEDAAYEAKIKDLQARLDALQPSTDTLLKGANVGPLPDKSQYPSQMDATRVYYAGGDNNITTSNGKVRGQALAFKPKVILNSHATRTNAEYDALCNSRAAAKVDGVEEVMIRQHEPWSKIKSGLYTLAQWQAEQRRASKIARDNGFLFGSILMYWTLFQTADKTRSFPLTMNPLDPELYDLPGFDYYPDNTPNESIATAMSRMQDAITKWAGDKPWSLGEFGVNGKANSAKAVDQTGQLLEAVKDTNCVRICWFSVGENAMTKPVADKFFA